MELVNKTIENFRVFERMCLSTASGMTFEEQSENVKFCQPRFEKSHAELLHMLHQAYSETCEGDLKAHRLVSSIILSLRKLVWL